MLKLRKKLTKGSWVAIVIILFFLFYGLASEKTGRLPWYQQLVVSLLSPLQKSLLFVGEGIGGLWNHYVNFINVTEENVDLRKITSRQMQQINELREVALENYRLRSLLKFKKRTGLDAVGAEVIAHDPRGDFKVVSINRGSEDGVDVNMPVVAAEGLVGRVVEAGGHISRILLITDPNSAVDVLVTRSRARALLVGKGKETELNPSYYLSRLEYLSGKSDIQDGDSLVTSGFDRLYPPGIPVGTVKDLLEGQTGVFKRAEVVPFVDFNSLEEVLVVGGM